MDSIKDAIVPALVTGAVCAYIGSWVQSKEPSQLGGLPKGIQTTLANAVAILAVGFILKQVG